MCSCGAPYSSPSASPLFLFPLPSPFQCPRPAAANPEIALLAKGDAQLRRALQSSTRVGQLLLKQEEGEADKVKRYSDDLLKKHR